MGQKGNNGQFCTKPQCPQRLFASQPGALTSVPQEQLLLLADFPSKGDGEFFHLSVPLWDNLFCALHQIGSDISDFCCSFASVLAQRNKELKEERKRLQIHLWKPAQ